MHAFFEDDGALKAGTILADNDSSLQIEAATGKRIKVKSEKVLLRFTTFNQRTTPEIYGAITRISADISTDQRSGASYYTIRIGMSGEEIARLGEVRLVPGMPVETFVQTGERTVMSYLVKPLYDQLSRAFREK